MQNVNVYSMILAIVGLITSSAVARAANPSDAHIDIRTKSGKVLIASEEIVAYDWPTHTLTLTPPVRPWLLTAHHKGLLAPEPFIVAVGGKAVYEGDWMSVAMSSSRDSPVIKVDEQVIDPQLGKDQLRIGLGYPHEKFFTGDDPRNAEIIEQSLAASGKLRPKPARSSEVEGVGVQ